MTAERRIRANGGPRGALRAAAARAFARTLASRGAAEVHLRREGRSFDERDRRLLAELVYGALRWKLRLEAVLERASGRDLQRIDPELRPVLLVALFQLLFLDRVPAHAAVSEAVDEARRRRGRSAGFVNAVLRSVARRPALEAWPVEESDPIRRLAVEHSHPEAMVRRWVTRFGLEAATRALVAGNSERALHLLAFADRGGREALAARLAADGVETEPGRLSPLALVVRSGRPLDSGAFRDGELYVQDEASQAAALVPPPAPRETVLDASAAPGGKGLALIAAEPSARVVFADAAVPRVARLAENSRRLRRKLPIAVADARRPPWSIGFDRVVLDAPCTGTGTLRRHPELRWRFREEELDRLARQALELLDSLAGSVAVGGRLVHVTCSIEAEENEEVGASFLAAHRQFEIDPLEALPASLSEGRDAAGRWRVLPGAGHDGFSVAAWRRRR